MATLSWDSPRGREDLHLAAETLIGRSPSNDICLTSPGVSGVHARIIRSGDRWLLEDMGSKNGSFVNDELRARCELRDGDVVGIGQVDLTFHVTPVETAMPAPTEATESRTLVWKKGVGETPIPRGQADATGFTGQTTSFGELVRGDVEYNRVSTVDPQLFTTRILPGVSEDPIQLARRLKASYEISRATAATLDQSELLDRVLSALFGIFEDADRAFIVLVDPQTGEMSTAAERQRGGKSVDMGISQTALEHAMRQREAMLCRDAAADERFAQAQSIVGLGIRSMMIAPLVFQDQVLGAVHVDTVRGIREFSQADLELLFIAASQVAGCLANARLHEKVVAAERLAAVGQTLAGLTHCIKNILQGIKGGAFILDKGINAGNLDRVRSGWDMVRRNNAFMEELVYDLLTYSKQRRPECVPTDVNTLCAEICELSAERAKQNGVALTCSLDPLLGPLDVDPRGLRRCVLNLVANAVDACAGNGGSVTAETKAPTDDGFARISIRDTGRGMSEETLAKLFTVFFSTKGSKGTGLGLPVTQKIIEEHKGRLDVESQEGQGTTFTICLPAKRVETRTAIRKQ